MKMLDILVDIDDVLMPCTGPAADIVREQIGYDISYDNCNAWAFTDHPEDIQKAMFSVINSEIFHDQQTPAPGAVEFIDKLQAIGHNVIIFSAVGLDQMAYRAKKISSQFHIPSGNVILGGFKYLMAADLIFDDGPGNILKSKCRHKLMMRHPWNEDIQQVPSVAAWDYDAALEMIDKIANAPEEAVMPVTKMNEPGVIAIVGPTASGKTALTTALLKDPRFALVKAVTTRAPRTDDREHEYNNVGQYEFDHMALSEELIEWSSTGDICYGIREDDLEYVWSHGQIAVKAMDIAGAMMLKKNLGEKALVVFVRRNKEMAMKAIIESCSSTEQKVQALASLDDEYNNEYLCDWSLMNNDSIDATMRQLLRIIGQ